MPVYKDQIGQSIRIDETPQRIISLVPSQTELLFDLGLESEVVGITKFCIHPEKWFRTKTRVGGTKKIDIQKVRDLHPDLIIANKEENTKEDVKALSAIAPVWVSDVNSLEDALSMILTIGEITGKLMRSRKICETIELEFRSLETMQMDEDRTVLYCIWNEPLIVVGNSTFINDMLNHCGLKNTIEEDRYPELTDNTLHPDLVLLSSEPYPFTSEHLKEFQVKFPQSEIKLVDGEAFSWYGSRLIQSPAYFRSLFTTEIRRSV